MAYSHPTTIIVAFCELAHVKQVQILGAYPEIEMHVDVDVEFPCDLENTVDLAGRVAVGIRGRANDAGSAFQGFHHQFVGSRVVQETFLREHADLDVNSPFVLVNKRKHTFQTAMSDTRIYFK